MIFLCFCAYNEVQNLPILLKSLAVYADDASYNVRIIAYEDGSADATPALLQKATDTLPLKIITARSNHGLGAGIGTVIKELSEHAADDDIALFFDADNTHDLAQLPEFMGTIHSGADVVIGSRFLRQSVIIGFPLHRRILSYLASYYFRLCLSVAGLKDYTSGFRAYRVGILKKLDLRKPLSHGFECQAEIISLLAPVARFQEIPITYSYDKKRGASKMRVLKTIRRSILLGVTIFIDRLKRRQAL